MYNKFIKNIYFPFIEKIKGEKIIQYKYFLSKSQYWSKEKLQQLQLEKLKSIIHHSYKNVPYYNQLFNQHNISPDKIKTIDDLAKIPTLTKEIIQKKKDLLHIQNYNRKIYRGKTSGSSGRPLEFYCTPEYSSWDWAARWRARNWYGVNIGDSEVAIWGRPLYSKKQEFLDKIKAKIRNTVLISAFELSNDDLQKNLTIIQKAKPTYIYGYSSSIFQLALYVKEVHPKIQLPHLKAIFVTAETLFSYQKAIIENIFKVPVSNEYGCSEIGGFAYECKYGNWHVSWENVVVEFIENSDGQQEIVATSLTNYYMPFIRYKIGDFGTFIEKKCECGVNLPIIKINSAKITDKVILKNNQIFSSEIFDYINLALMKNNIQGFNQFQIVQKSIDTFQVNFIKNNAFQPSSLSSFETLLKKTLKDAAINVLFNEKKNIKKESTGKIRYFVSDLK